MPPHSRLLALPTPTHPFRTWAGQGGCRLCTRGRKSLYSWPKVLQVIYLFQSQHTRRCQCPPSATLVFFFFTHPLPTAFIANSTSIWYVTIARKRLTSVGIMCGSYLSPLTGSLCAWYICTLFMLLCQYFTKPPWSDVSIHWSLWLHTMARTDMSWACKKSNAPQFNGSLWPMTQKVLARCSAHTVYMCMQVAH